jgi:hypothetical protein
MNLLQLANELNISPKRVASTNGGEYHSPCPSCGGKDRFIIWEKQGRYLCRQCTLKGDAIQFCRDFMGMDYRSACSKVGNEPKISFKAHSHASPSFEPLHAEEPPIAWQNSAGTFVQQSTAQILQTPEAISELTMRGFAIDTVKLFSLGWNPINQFAPRPDWGLPIAYNEQGREKKIWLPKGLIIPTFIAGKVAKLKVRRSDWNEQDELPKYIEVTGSMKCPSVYGLLDTKKILIVESEFDGMLIQQYAADLCACMAIGGASKKPDRISHDLLKHSDLTLFALDFDAAGKAAYRFWRSTYSNLRAWPISRGKSPGDALKIGVNLRQWVLDGFNTNNIC